MIRCRGSVLRAPTLHLCGECHVSGQRFRAFCISYRGVAQLVVRAASGSPQGRKLIASYA